MAWRLATYRVTVEENRWIKHPPTLKQQQALLLDHVQEILYGGAAGGGKSEWLLMEALKYVDQPGYSALLLRRNLTDLALPGALIDRAHEWLQGTTARWSEKDKTWRFPSGATLTFGYLDEVTNHYRYQSSEFHFVGFDELTQFSEYHYRYLFSRLRRLTGVRIPRRMRAASNPGGIGHEWVRERFLTGPADPQRVFIPARLDDNPHLDQAEYLASLGQLDAVERARLRDGNWEVQNQGLVYPELVDCVIAPRPLTPHRCWGGIDWGFRNPAALLVAITDDEGQLYVVEEVYGSRMTTDDLVLRAAELQRRYPIELWYCDAAEPGSIETFRRNDLPALAVAKGQNSILHGVQAVSTRLRTKRLLVFQNCPNLIRESKLYRYPTPEERRLLGENPIDEHNHALSALRYLVSGVDRVREIACAKRSLPEPDDAAMDPKTAAEVAAEAEAKTRAAHEKQMAEWQRQQQRDYLWNVGWDRMAISW
jgi:PBSX family phage terminase large subunit